MATASGNCAAFPFCFGETPALTQYRCEKLATGQDFARRVGASHLHDGAGLGLGFLQTALFLEYERPLVREDPDSGMSGVKEAGTLEADRGQMLGFGELPAARQGFSGMRGDVQNAGGYLAGNGGQVGQRDEPVVSWEMGLRAGEDLRILPDEGFFGFGVDGGTGCFFDAIAAPAMAGLTRGFVLGTGMTTTELTDPESGGNLIAFHCGWGDGSYPTWVGRTASGDVACFIADMHEFDKVDPDRGTDPPQ